MKKLEPIQVTFNIPIEELDILQFCEICETSRASKLIVTQIDAFYACLTCAIMVNQISNLSQHLPN